MRINTEVRASVGGLLGLQIITSFAAIALLARLGPAIEQILEENVYSIRAVEAMERALAARGTVPVEQLTTTFTEALERAFSNVTEPGESEHIEGINQHYESALEGDHDALAATLQHVEALGEVNHDTMRRADERARRLAQAGSWAAVVLALLGLGLSLLVIRRLTRRVVYPLNELHDAVSRYRRGDPYRRCAAHDAPTEVVAVAETINALLDERLESTGRPEPATPARDRAILLHLLDEKNEPTLVMDLEGNVLAANKRGLDRLGESDSDGLKQRLHRALRGSAQTAEKSVLAWRERVGDDLFIVALAEPAAPSA